MIPLGAQSICTRLCGHDKIESLRIYFMSVQFVHRVCAKHTSQWVAFPLELCYRWYNFSQTLADLFSVWSFICQPELISFECMQPKLVLVVWAMFEHHSRNWQIVSKKLICSISEDNQFHYWKQCLWQRMIGMSKTWMEKKAEFALQVNSAWGCWIVMHWTESPLMLKLSQGVKHDG